MKPRATQPHRDPANASTWVDVFGLSCTQGWTCGNLVATPRAVAEFFYLLLGERRLLSNRSLEAMQEWKPTAFAKSQTHAGSFQYGLGLMDFNSMDWGFAGQGRNLGHNGLTYGFGAQSSYNDDLGFAMSLVNNVEFWIGPDLAKSGQQDALYKAVAETVRRFRTQEESVLV